VNFDLPGHLPPLLERMDAFIEAEIVPLREQRKQFFDERREFARTDLDRGGLPSREWEELLTQMQMRRVAQRLFGFGRG
jgi:acyl-CoA dehydrogenase